MQDDPPGNAKPFEISKRFVWDAWKRVAANKGAAGVDVQSIDGYREKLGANLYVLWNRMSSGSYRPDAIRRVDIPKGDGAIRSLGIPTVRDRIAQMVVKLAVEPRLERIFHPWSFGYRPGRSALQAVHQARRNSWRFDWVVDLDIAGFFDTIDHDLLMRAVEKHIPERWIQLYIRRWLKSPVQMENGELTSRSCGTPQGGVISPLLSNLFLHYVFDDWMRRHHPGVPFERYADDIVCHCRDQAHADAMLQALKERFESCRLRLHPIKTQVVYCRDGRRRDESERVSYDFLGFTFRARTCQDPRGKLFTGFNPAVGQKAMKRMTQALRALKIHRRTQLSLPELAEMVNPMLRGWIGYFGGLYPLRLKRFLSQLDLRLGAWARRKYKPLRGHKRRSWAWLRRWRERNPQLFAHWSFIYSPVAG